MEKSKWVKISSLTDVYEDKDWRPDYHPFHELTFTQIKEIVEEWLEDNPEFDDLRIQECNEYVHLNYGASHYKYWYELQGLAGNKTREILYGRSTPESKT